MSLDDLAFHVIATVTKANWGGDGKLIGRATLLGLEVMVHMRVAIIRARTAVINFMRAAVLDSHVL